MLEALSPKKRGRKEKEKNPLVQKVAQLERENEQLKQKLKKAEIIIDFNSFLVVRGRKVFTGILFLLI